MKTYTPFAHMLHVWPSSEQRYVPGVQLPLVEVGGFGVDAGGLDAGVVGGGAVSGGW